jgi:hypothetical protein
MPKWLEEKLVNSGVRNPYAVMNAAHIDKGDAVKSVSAKMSAFMKGKHKKGGAK